MEETAAHDGMVCTKCGEYRLLSVFRVRDGKLKQPCKKCYLEYGRRHYRNNKQYYLDKAKRYNDALWEKTRMLVWEYLRQHPCVDCGIADPRVMEFDHVRGVKKVQCQRNAEPAPYGQGADGRNRQVRCSVCELSPNQDLRTVSMA